MFTKRLTILILCSSVASEAMFSGIRQAVRQVTPIVRMAGMATKTAAAKVKATPVPVHTIAPKAQLPSGFSVLLAACKEQAGRAHRFTQEGGQRARQTYEDFGDKGRSFAHAGVLTAAGLVAAAVAARSQEQEEKPASTENEDLSTTLKASVPAAEYEQLISDLGMAQKEDKSVEATPATEAPIAVKPQAEAVVETPVVEEAQPAVEAKTEESQVQSIQAPAAQAQGWSIETVKENAQFIREQASALAHKVADQTTHLATKVYAQGSDLTHKVYAEGSKLAAQGLESAQQAGHGIAAKTSDLVAQAQAYPLREKAKSFFSWGWSRAKEVAKNAYNSCVEYAKQNPEKTAARTAFGLAAAAVVAENVIHRK